MAFLRNKYFIGIAWISVMILLVVSFLLISVSYFNTKEISSLTSGCYQKDGEVILEIHNDLTNAYSFACEK